MILIIWTYVGIAVFLIAAAIRIQRQLALPLHLRWELYPVKHEAGERAEYGGSYMEEGNWWEKERKRSFYNEIKYMIPEILFLRGSGKKTASSGGYPFPSTLGFTC